MFYIMNAKEFAGKNTISAETAIFDLWGDDTVVYVLENVMKPGAARKLAASAGHFDEDTGDIVEVTFDTGNGHRYAGQHMITAVLTKDSDANSLRKTKGAPYACK